MAKIGFIGLGVMGFPMAGHLQKAGHAVTVFNRTATKADSWVARYGGASGPTPAAAADGADFVFTCVGNDDDLRAVTLGRSGCFETLKPGAVFIDHTTASAHIARELSAAALARTAHALDAPVSGGQSGAENAQLGIMVGGDAAAFAKAEPILNVYAKALALIGPSGSGQLTKMVNQIAIAGLLQGLAEALHFGRTAGLDMEKVLGVISAGAASSWQMQNRASTMLRGAFDFGFAVNWMRKDLAIVLEEAQLLGLSLPVTALVDGYYAEVQAEGGGRWDTSSLITRFNKGS
jgi:3-hydroxyisobutyrate dehydrogenase